ncbi:MAG: hypothetical protein RBT65_01295 [Methanolobus sp.]|nr:hypothetical protein [Methanolobus sp.]
MFSIIMDVFKLLKNWQKALLFSFVSYAVVLFFVIVAIVFIFSGFSRNLPIIMGVAVSYMFLLILAMVIARHLFKKRLIVE